MPHSMQVSHMHSSGHNLSLAAFCLRAVAKNKLKSLASGNTAHAIPASEAAQVLLLPQPARWPATAAVPAPCPAPALMLGPPCSRAGTARCGLPSQATGLHTAPLRLPVRTQHASQLGMCPVLAQSSGMMIHQGHIVGCHDSHARPCVHRPSNRYKHLLLRSARDTGLWCRLSCQQEVVPAAVSGRRPRQWVQAEPLLQAADCQRSAS